MTREEARKLAQAEIDYVVATNRFKTDALDDIYHGNDGNLIDSKPKFLELFADYFMIQNTPLMNALKERK